MMKTMTTVPRCCTTLSCLVSAQISDWFSGLVDRSVGLLNITRHM